VKDENGDFLTDSHNVLNRSKNFFSQLLNLHRISDVRQIEVHTAETLVPGPSRLEVETDIAKLKKYESSGSDQLPAQHIKAGGEIQSTNQQSTNSLLIIGIRKNFLSSGRSLLL
jgi:hypothetical protein